MKYFVVFAVLCLGVVSAATIEVQVLETPVRISNKDIVVEIKNSNLSLAEQVNAAEILSNIYPHLGNNQERAWAFTETYKYLAPNCIWSVAVNADSVHANKVNGKTGHLIMRVKDTTGGAVQIAEFYAFSMSKSGANCVIP